jgi:hypothetical protein
MRRGCVNCASTAGPTTPAWSRSAARPWTTSGRHPAYFPPRQDAPQLRLPHEPGADPQPGPVGRQPGISSHRRSRQRGRPQGRAALEQQGVRALNPAMGFPMEMDRFPGKIWVVSHKPVAVAAGLGHMGIHRNVIHPKFGNFIVLGTVLIDAEATPTASRSTTTPAWNASCAWRRARWEPSRRRRLQLLGLLHAQLPGVHGRLHRLGRADRRQQGRLDYRKKVSDPESASMWQSLSFGPNYKAAYCLAVCPAGEDVIGPFLTDKDASSRDTCARSPRRKRRSTSSPARTPRTMWPAASRTRRSNGWAVAAAPDIARLLVRAEV